MIYPLFFIDLKQKKPINPIIGSIGFTVPGIPPGGVMPVIISVNEHTP
jgi:hypothetical protein